LKQVEKQAFLYFKGTLAITGEYPVLETVGEGAFQSAGTAESTVAIECSAPAGLTVASNAFDSFKGTPVRTGEQTPCPETTKTTTAVTATTTVTATSTTTSAVPAKKAFSAASTPAPGNATTALATTPPPRPPQPTSSTTAAPSTNSREKSKATIPVAVAAVLVTLCVAVVGWRYFAGRRRSSTARGNHGGELDGFVNESIEMMDNPMRAASVGRGGAAEEARYAGYEPPVMEQNASAGSEFVYAVPVEDAAGGARVPNPLYQPADGPSANNRTLVRLPNPIYQPASNSMHDDGEAAVVARVLNQSSLYSDADPVPSEEMAAASGLNAAASTTTTSATAGAAAGKCARPSPSGGVCKKAAVPGSLFCKGHTCPAPGCTAGKSTKMVTCPSHVHVNIDGPRPAVGEVFYDAFGGAADNDHNDGAAQTSSPAAPLTNGAIYAVSAKQSARTAAVADNEGNANAVNC